MSSHTRSTRETSWSTRSTAVPAAAMARMRSPSHWLSVLSRPAAGSSSRSTSGSAALALAQLAGGPIAQSGDAHEIEGPGHGRSPLSRADTEHGDAHVLLDAQVV